ncbi:MAG: aspartate-semialdehyde dehydrogenase, partial [Gammaproteobacteria bacterium]|nr:aspartate-semialdehyde dehydrogenase [Gammaproteobacteria bacterium]
EAVHLETAEPVELQQVRDWLTDAEGVRLIEGDQDPMPMVHASGHDEVFIGRIRRDLTHSCGVDLWVVSDNLRKGAALNAIQIAEYLAQRRPKA